jgi:hypothetical protein
MTAKKSDKNAESHLRSPKAKNRFGLSIPKITLPHDEFVKTDVGLNFNNN